MPARLLLTTLFPGSFIPEPIIGLALHSFP